MTMQPDVDPIKEGMQNECCKDNLEFYFEGDGVEWELWECEECKLKYVVPIEIVRYFDGASVVLNEESDNERRKTKKKIS